MKFAIDNSFIVDLLGVGRQVLPDEVRERCWNSVLRASKAGFDFVLPTPVMSEFYANSKLELAKLEEHLTPVIRLADVADFSSVDGRVAADLFRARFRKIGGERSAFYLDEASETRDAIKFDSLIFAIAITRNCEYLLTGNASDFRPLDGERETEGTYRWPTPLDVESFPEELERLLLSTLPIFGP